MTNAVATQADTPAAVMEKVVVGGDLSKLSTEERLGYYAKVCESVGLNPLTKPFEYITLNGKLTLYARKDCTDQLRAIHKISIQIVGRDLLGDIYVVTARASRAGREDESTGAVPINSLKGADLANAYMKAETKAKRRVTLSISGLGLPDESEIEDLPPDVVAERPVVAMPKALTEKPAEPKKPEVDPAKKLEPGQIKVLEKTLGRSGIAAEALCKEFGVPTIAEIPFGKINDAIKYAAGPE